MAGGTRCWSCSTPQASNWSTLQQSNTPPPTLFDTPTTKQFDTPTTEHPSTTALALCSTPNHRTARHSNSRTPRYRYATTQFAFPTTEQAAWYPFPQGFRSRPPVKLFRLRQGFQPTSAQILRVFPKLFGQSTAIGLDLQGDHFCAVRVRLNDRKVELTHHMETPDFGALGRELEKADRIITRPPPKTWFNRRAAKVSGDWTSADQPSFKQRGLEVFRVAQRWTPLPMEQTLFGWEALSHHSGTNTSEIEIHQSEKSNCHEFRLALQSLKLGPVYFEAWHTTALRAAIPPRFTSYILETRSPDGYALVKNGALVGHVDLTVFHPPYDPEDPNVERLKTFLAEHLTAGKGPLQAYFLNRNQRAPQMPGLSCSWIGDNCRELVGKELSVGCLQALGLALSSNREWWLHHVDEFRPGPGPMQRLRSVMSDLGL